MTIELRDLIATKVLQALLQRAYARSTPPTAERPHPFVPVLMDVAPPGTPHFPLVYPDSPIDPSKLS